MSGVFTLPPKFWQLPVMSRDKSDTLLLLSACVLVLLPHAEHVAWWVSVCCGVLFFWRGWITWSGRRLPRATFLIPVTLVLMLGVYASFKTFLGRDVGITMLALLLTCKLLEMHAKRDLFVVIFLSHFLLLTSFLFSQTIGTAALAVVSLSLLLTAQLSFHFTGSYPSFFRRLKIGISILGFAIPITLVAFVLFPRIQGPLWSLPGDAHKGRTGLSESMAPGNISELAQSEDIAFRVKFLDLPANTAPQKSLLYWRGVVLNEFDGVNWEKSRYRLLQADEVINRSGKTTRQEILLEPTGQRWLLAIDLPTAAPKIDNLESRLNAAEELRTNEPITNRLRYQVESQLNYTYQANLSENELARSLSLPPNFNPKSIEFAHQLRTQFPDDAAAIQQVLLMFHNQKFEYTLEPPLLGEHSIDDFLFVTRAGFCEHYASAFVVLMRAMEIPARVVTGYQGGELNEVDGYWEVRQSDAHAWAEVWLGNKGWVRIDPTAAVAPNRVSLNLFSTQRRRGIAGALSNAIGGSTILADIRMHWDAINNSWNQWVLNYNQKKQLDLMRSFGFKDVDWSQLTIAFFIFSSAVIAIISLPLLRNRVKGSAVDKLYFSLCKKLEKKASARAVFEGPRTYLTRLQPALPEHEYAPIREFISLYEHAKYGNSTLSEAELIQQLKKLLAQCV